MSRTLFQEVDALHDSFVAAVNHAVAEGDLGLAEELAQAYDREAIQLLAEREGKTHLLPLRRLPRRRPVKGKRAASAA